jgi:hypothetical protein
MYSDNWGTPDHVLQIVRDLYGPFTHDLASCEEHQEIVRAMRYWSEADPCPPQVPVSSDSVLWCNPPGPRTRVEWFWRVWQDAIFRGAHGGFLVFKQDHFRALPAPEFPCTTIALRQRVKFIRSKEEIAFLRAEAKRKGEKYKHSGGATFPSTLVLDGRWAADSAFRNRLAKHGHAQVWEK